MKCSDTHAHPQHLHGAGCGHTAILHNGHIDYLHDGHLHHPHQDHCDEHCIDVSETNPDNCNPVDCCGKHVHGPDCGHEAIPHNDHTDYVVDGRLHHAHDGHCDDHGPVEIIHA